MNRILIWMWVSLMIGPGKLSAQDQPVKIPGVQADEKVLELQNEYLDGLQEKMIGNIDKAIAKFKHVLSVDGRNDAAAYQLARIYQAKEDIAAALDYIEKAMQYDPTNKFYVLMAAEIQEKKSAFNLAAHLYEGLHKTQRLPINYYERWAEVLAAEKLYEEAALVLGHLEQNTGLQPEISRKKYDYYVLSGKNNKALEELLKLVNSDADNTSYLLMVATHYRNENKLEKAEEYYQRILRLDPNHTQANLALAQKNRHNVQNGSAYLLNLLPIIQNPQVDLEQKIREITPYLDKIKTHADQNTLAALKTVGEALVQAHGDQWRALMLYGDILAENKEDVPALEQYQRATKLAPTQWVAFEKLIQQTYHLHQSKQLLIITEQAMDLFPTQARVFIGHAQALMHHQKYAEALRSLQDATLMSAGQTALQAEILALQGYLSQMSGHPVEAIKFIEQLNQLNHKPIEALRWQAYVLLQQENTLEEGFKIIKSIQSLDGDHYAGKYLQGLYHYRKKDINESREWLQKALQHDGDHDFEVLELYGDVLYQAQLVQEALQYWIKARDLRPAPSASLNKKITSKQLSE